MEEFKQALSGAFEFMNIPFTVLGIEVTLWQLFIFCFLLYCISYFLFKLLHHD